MRRVAGAGEVSKINMPSGSKPRRSARDWGAPPGLRSGQHFFPAGVPAPATPQLFTGVYTFPWYLSTLKAWFWLTLGGLAIGLGLHATLNYWPWK